MIDIQVFAQLAGRLSLTLLIVSAGLAFIRLIKGPQAADRIVALDLIAVLVIAFLAAFAAHTGDTSFLDVAIAYGLVAFLGTVALSRFLLRAPKRKEDHHSSGRKL
jgi:multicomponent Na+:H+ antiporter subunit F